MIWYENRKVGFSFAMFQWNMRLIVGKGKKASFLLKENEDGRCNMVEKVGPSVVHLEHEFLL